MKTKGGSMDKKKINDDQLLSLFENYSDEEILRKINENIYFYRRLKKIEPLVIEILNKYGVQYYRTFESFKQFFEKVLYCAKLRKIKYRNVEYRIRINDLIEMIKINRDLEIDNVLENFSYYYGYIGNNEWDINNLSLDTDTGLDIKVNEIRNQYQKIIDDILEESKQKIKVR